VICQITLVTAARVSGQIRNQDRCGEPRQEERKRINITKKDAEIHTKKIQIIVGNHLKKIDIKKKPK
jgi:hypothetical protein